MITGVRLHEVTLARMLVPMHVCMHTVKALINAPLKIIPIRPGAFFGVKKLLRTLKGALFREAPSN